MFSYKKDCGKKILYQGQAIIGLTQRQVWGKMRKRQFWGGLYDLYG